MQTKNRIKLADLNRNSERIIDRLKFLAGNPPQADCSLLQGNLPLSITPARQYAAAPAPFIIMNLSAKQ
jgi:hypothetical protein